MNDTELRLRRRLVWLYEKQMSAFIVPPMEYPHWLAAIDKKVAESDNTTHSWITMQDGTVGSLCGIKAGVPCAKCAEKTKAGNPVVKEKQRLRRTK